MAASLFKWFTAGILCLSAGGRVSTDLHPLYITVTEITQNAREKTLEISCKIFTNDLETALEKQSHAKIDLSDVSVAGKANGDKWVADYVTKHLLIKVDGKAAGLVFVGREKESDGTWCYFQAADVPAVKKIEINNTVLYDVFDQEINIMHAVVGGVKKSTRLNYPDARAVFEF